MMGIKRFNESNSDLLQVGSQFVRQSVGKINKVIEFMGLRGKQLDLLKSIEQHEALVGIIPMKPLKAIRDNYWAY